VEPAAAGSGGLTVHFWSGVAQFFDTWSNWTGTNGILHRLAQHVEVSAISVAVAAAIALPIALWIGHRGKGGFLAVTVANIGRALPSFAVLVVGAAWLGIGQAPALLALILLSIPPILTNAYTGVAGVDPDQRDAARGMGMTGWQVLRDVEIPAAVPMIFAGLRTATVQCVATATLAAYVGYGTLGQFINEGLANALNGQAELFAGGVLVVALALAAELGLAALQRVATPKGLRVTTTPAESVYFEVEVTGDLG
jgi:osmoprotectant transport system permease protein